MKFAKGILTDEKPEAVNAVDGVPEPPQPLAPKLAVVEVEKNRLFETVKEETRNDRRYLKVFGVIVIVVLAIGAGVYYFMAPGIGDQIKTPKGLEEVVREHFLTKEKRTATDITFYQCGEFLWARVGVETRNDIQNPLFRIATYSSRAISNGGQWNISAVPITSPEMDIPCR